MQNKDGAYSIVDKKPVARCCGALGLSVCLVVFASACAETQAVSEGGMSLASANLAGPTTLNARSDLERGSTTDIISGNNSPGPYMLAWNSIRPNNDSVVVDGRPAMRGVDYNIDYAKGIIAFSSALKASSLARVDYGLDPKSSTRNNGSLAVPLSLSIFANDSSSLQMTALYKQNGNANSGSSVLGLQGNTQLGSATKLTSAVYFGQGQTGYDLGQRTAANLGLATKIGSMAFTGSYIAAGQGFTGAKDYGLTAGQGTQAFGMAWAPSGSRLAFDSGYQRVGTGAVGVSTVTNHLSYNLTPSSKLLFSRQSVAQNGIDTVTNEWKLGSQFGKFTSTQFVWNDKTTASDHVLSLIHI